MWPGLRDGSALLCSEASARRIHEPEVVLRLVAGWEAEVPGEMRLRESFAGLFDALGRWWAEPEVQTLAGRRRSLAELNEKSTAEWHERKGRLGQALYHYTRLYLQTRDILYEERVDRCLAAAIREPAPDSPPHHHATAREARATLEKAATEVVDLEIVCAKLRSKTSPEVAALLEEIVRQRDAADGLWRNVDRMHAASLLAGSSGRDWSREQARLAQHLETIRSARQELARLAMAGGRADRQALERIFGAVRQAAEQLNEDHGP